MSGSWFTCLRNCPQDGRLAAVKTARALSAYSRPDIHASALSRRVIDAHENGGPDVAAAQIPAVATLRWGARVSANAKRDQLEMTEKLIHINNA